MKIGGSFSGLLGDAHTYYICAPIIGKLAVGKASYARTQMSVAGQFGSIGKASAFSVAPLGEM